MRPKGVLPLLAAVLMTLAVSACGSSSPTSAGAPVGSSAIRSKLEQAILSSSELKTPEVKKIVGCIIAKMSAAGITTNGQADSHQNQVSQFSTACAEKVAAGAG